MSEPATVERAIAPLDLELPEGRGAIPFIHEYLRACILDGRLPPGEQLSQVKLAKALGVSRTPLREALRMLQEEGLVEGETNQRSRVAGFDAIQLDSDYACRILLEALALEMTAPELTPADMDLLDDLLERMRAAGERGDVDTWLADHSMFHGLLTGGANDLLLKQLRSFADRSIRYIRIIQRSQPQTWTAPGDVEHTAIVASLHEGAWAEARSTLAAHLARTALRVLTDLSPEYEPTAVRRALTMVSTPTSTGI